MRRCHQERGVELDQIFFAGWPGVVRTLLCGSLAYVMLVLLLRASGKRTLTRMNAFDFVVTIALGSILATITLSKDVALLEGTAALGILIGLQYLVAWLSARFKAVNRLVKAEPALLFHRGEFLCDAMRRERITEDEVRAAIRSENYASLQEIEVVVLETDGSISVVSRGAPSDSALSNVSGYAD